MDYNNNYMGFCDRRRQSPQKQLTWELINRNKQLVKLKEK